MTLFKQIMMAIVFFGLIVFSVVGYLNFNSLNNYINDQLGTNARHTANSLGLSIKSVADIDDLSMIETMINSIFDSGYYQMIRLDDIDDNVLLENSQEINVEAIPNWFIKMIKLNAPIQSSEIMTGWAKFGTLYVQGNTGLAYYQLYNGMKDIFYALSAIFIAMLICTYFALKAIFRPLNEVRKQAEAIRDSNFIIQERIPYTKDLKDIVVAMNSMVYKVKSIFDKESDTFNKYQEILYKDSLSGLYNRRYFQAKVSEYVNTEEYSSGVIMLLGFKDLVALKKSLGFEKWQSFTIKISHILQENIDTSKYFGFASKLNDNDFSILLVGANSKQLGEMSKIIMNEVKNSFKIFDIDENENLVNMALVDYHPKTDMKSLMTIADVTLANARMDGNFCIREYNSNTDLILLGKEKYRELITKSMQNNMFKFAGQNVIDGDKIEHTEIYLRLVDEHGKWQMASYFMPMVSELELGAVLDLHVLERASNMIINQNINNAIAINLGKDIITSDINFIKLCSLFKKIGSNLKNKVYIEIPNKDDISIGSIIKLTNAMKEFGLKLGLDHFEFNQSGINRLKEINPSYVKIRAANLTEFFDGKDIDEVKKSLDIIMGLRDIKIIGIGVENQEQKDRLLEFGITSMQGIYIDETKNIG